MAYAFFTFVIVTISVGSGHPLNKYRKTVSTRIIGGVEAPEGYAPHMAALVWGESFKSLMCGGSIISKKHILTAAHCIDPLVVRGQLISSFRAVVGSNRWASTETLAAFSHYNNHPNWNPATIKNDIGLLFLLEELDLNDRVAIIPLNFESIGEGVECYASGWGRVGPRYDNDILELFPIPDVMQVLYLKTVSTKDCMASLQKASDKHGVIPPLDPNIEICTFHSKGHGMCNGDSGSALVSMSQGSQIGIVSWGIPCADGYPDVYVRLSAYKGYLRSLLE